MRKTTLYISQRNVFMLMLRVHATAQALLATQNSARKCDECISEIIGSESNVATTAKTQTCSIHIMKAGYCTEICEPKERRSATRRAHGETLAGGLKSLLPR